MKPVFSRVQLWWRLSRSQRVIVGERSFSIPPGVLDPVLFRSGAWFAEYVYAHVCQRTEPTRLLDLGTGSGVVGVLAQSAGAAVVGIDIDPRAVAAARQNGLKDVRAGDLFDPVPNERFDLICWNPPYFPARKQRPWSADRRLRTALYGGDDLAIIRRFADQVGQYLTPEGAAWLLWTDRAPPIEPLVGTGWTRITEATVHAGDGQGGERLSVWEWSNRSIETS